MVKHRPFRRGFTLVELLIVLCNPTSNPAEILHDFPPWFMIR
ncbi:MAG: pilus assembly FimT family protein [Rickettsiales bacterium]